ncbi:PREDICTED: probable phospholipid-transporting ATPase IF [Rhagoletis zephyria]|uniref:probable phospholipid-transporting ATPase IF n=1 Tax=Rhagoletis zephyria TaxID=28612 RepID=UPI00081121C2|nr:PREDICTED: probable phospholipid-transporting ATPase IF [Rhagoletis zephyria]
MNFVGRHDHIAGGYRRVNAATYGFTLSHNTSETKPFVKESLSWKWHKGSRVSTINDWLQIKIGGDEEVKKKKGRQQLNRIKSTKYTIITFLPQNLLEQFRRIANFYFLIMTVISLVIDSPVSPMTSLLPLAFVIAVTAAKQGYEDFLRYRTDNVVNRSPVTVIRNGVATDIQSQHVCPGDLVVVERDCDVPCDLVLLRSTDPHGKCFITTANLDGESNLKTLLVPRDLPLVEINQLHKLGVIECESPKTDLYSFNGKIELAGSEGRVLPLSADNVLLRGSRVKNTECVIGCAVYTGMTTKLQLNSRLTRNKSASSEVYVNRFLVVVLVLMIGIVSMMYFFKRYEEIYVIPNLAYLGPAADGYSIRQFLQDYLSFLILFNYLIPISLYVTIELQRGIGGFFMEWDLQLYDEAADEHFIVNTSNLNEELGQIDILFSDKTGTLTKNEMIFQQCSINGRKYVFKKTRLLEEETGALIDINKFNKDQKNFFQALTICHTVQVAGDSDTNQAKEAETPDKEANGRSGLAKMYSISDITEESHNSSQQSGVNFDNIQGLETSITNNPNGQTHNSINSNDTINAINSNGTNGSIAANITSDINPLLDETDKVEKRKRPLIVKRSPNFTRATSRIHPVMSLPIQMTNGTGVGCTIEMVNRSTAPNLLVPAGSRPSSLPFTRSTSAIDLPDDGSVVPIATGHKRSQSYGAPGAYITQPGQQGGVLYRTASTMSRESYAAPNFQRQPTILIRAESQRRKHEIEQVVHTLDYQASSPDEKALVEACANLGLVYMGDDDDVLRIKVVPPHMDYSRPFSVGKVNEMHFSRLNVLEFTSDRKRMSVIVKDENGTKWIYTKGAESYVFPLCANAQSDIVSRTDAHISDFARQGLRTLAVARRRVGDHEYRQFVAGLGEANSSLENRKELLEQTYANIECNLELLGSTAVEDALQDEVADTLISLQKAGIKIWVLTGDKVETALNIALSCGHIPPDAIKYFIIDCQSKEDMLVHLNALDREIVFGIGAPCALLIDGKSLSIALSETPEVFRDIAIKCTAVLCCRLSPLQKSEVVSLIRTAKEGYTTAAVGDGANDVSMIQEAHVGLGIMGKEGRQAARCADFSFAKFCMLKRLILVHGHYHTTRLCYLVLYFFYKNIYFMGIMFLFQFYSLFSSGSVYDSLFLTLYNVIYTSLPILFISLTEKAYSEEMLMTQPELYKKNTNNKGLHWQYFLVWSFFGVYHTLVTFFFTEYVFSTNNVLLNVGQPAEFSCFGTLLMEIVVVVVNLKLLLDSKYLSYWFIVSIVGSILSFVITTVIYNVIDLDYDTDIYWAYNKLLCSLPIWLFTILTVIACLLPDYVIRVTPKAFNLPKRSFYPNAGRLKMEGKINTTHL